MDYNDDLCWMDLEKFKEYLRNTPQEQIEEEWNAVAGWGAGKPLYWYWKNWWLLPLVAVYNTFFWISLHLENAAVWMNGVMSNNLKYKK